jgi:hypothetical protein
VTVDGADCSIVTWSQTQVLCNLPAGQGTVNIIVTTINNAASVGYSFTYDRPVLSSFAPSEISTQGGTVVLTGSNFGSSGTITVGSSQCSITAWSDLEITCVVAGLTQSTTVALGHGSITVSVSGQTNSGPPVLGITSPSISQVDSAALTQGGFITITGSSFGTGLF